MSCNLRKQRVVSFHVGIMAHEDFYAWEKVWSDCELTKFVPGLDEFPFFSSQRNTPYGQMQLMALYHRWWLCITTVLLGLVERRWLHLLRVVVCTIRPRCHHSSHTRDCIAGLGKTFHRRSIKLGRVDIVGHTIRLVGHLTGLDNRGRDRRRSRRRSRGSRCRRCSHRHDVTILMSVWYKHGYHATWRQIWRLSAVLRVIVALRHRKILGLISRLERLEGRSVNSPFWDVGQGRTCRSLSRERRLAGVRIEGLWLRRRRSSMCVCRNLLVERLLFLLLRRVESHGRRRFDACDGDGLLRTRLVHGNLTLSPVLAEGRLLGKRVRLLEPTRGCCTLR
jgi:hypothetical protein